MILNKTISAVYDSESPINTKIVVSATKNRSNRAKTFESFGHMLPRLQSIDDLYI